eukprot:SAG31_NODE_24481_length_480_cov_1.141732_1_plen_80_part_10
MQRQRGQTMAALLQASLAAVAVSTTSGGGAAPASKGRRVLIWLYDCNAETMQALQNHSSAFTAVAPPMYAVGFNRTTGGA